MAGLDEHHQNLAPAAPRDALDRWERRLLDLAQFVRDFVERVIAHLLADHARIGLDAEQHPTAPMVLQRARPHRADAP